MKKALGSCIFILVFFIFIPAALALASMTTDKTAALPGETVIISGTAEADESVVIKIMDETGNIVCFDAEKADASGQYSASFVVPSDMAADLLTVTAGSGNDVATTTITVVSPPAATATPAPSASASASASTSASASASASASTSASASASASATSGEDDFTAMGTVGVEEEAIIPKEILQDEETGVITVVIDVDDLPEGSVAIETPDGEILYVSDAQNGVLTFEVTEDAVNSDGDIAITLLDEKMTPLSIVCIRVLDENGELAITNGNGPGGWIIAICIAIGLLILAAILWIWIHWRNKQKQSD